MIVLDVEEKLEVKPNCLTGIIRSSEHRERMRNMNKKLYRSNTQKMLTGVCGGIAESFNTDVSLIRLITVIVCLLFGPGILIYIAAAIIIPERTDGDIYDADYRDYEGK